MPNCMGASPPWGDRTRPARRRSSAGGGFEEVTLPRHQSAGHPVDDHVRLLEHEVAEERLVAVWSRLHLDEDHLSRDPPETLELDADGPTHLGNDDALVGRLDLDHLHLRQLAELVLPGEREDQSKRARVHERAELELSHWVQQVRDGDLYDHLAHVGRPPRIEGPDTGHRLTSLQCLEPSYHGHPCPPRPAAPARSPPCTASSSSRRSSARSPTPPGSSARWPAAARRSPACAGRSRCWSPPAPASTCAACADSAPS